MAFLSGRAGKATHDADSIYGVCVRVSNQSLERSVVHTPDNDRYGRLAGCWPGHRELLIGVGGNVVRAQTHSLQFTHGRETKVVGELDC